MIIAASDLHLGPGVDVRKSGLGGYGVWLNGKHVGWMHESGDKWNAYRPNKIGPGIALGKFPLTDAVNRILREAGWSGAKAH